MLKQKLIMLKGCPASGKSTKAKELVDNSGGQIKRVSKDDLRSLLDNGKWSRSNEKFILKARDLLISSSLNSGYSVISDDTNLAPEHEKTLRNIADIMRADFEILDFTHVPLETCLERDRKRANYVGEKVIRDMYKKYLYKETKVNAPVWDYSLPTAIICDLDGTLCLRNGRSPYDYSKVYTDIRCEEVYEILFNSSAEVIFVSGRPEADGAKAPNVRYETEKWLRDNTVFDGINHPLKLFMRPAGDKRKDFIIKREIYEREISGKYNVLFVLDDRSTVVSMWRSLGLKCLQVAEGDF